MDNGLVEQSEKIIEKRWRVIYFKITDSIVTTHKHKKRFSRESLDVPVIYL